MRRGCSLLLFIVLATGAWAVSEDLGLADAPAVVRRVVFRAETAYRRGDVEEAQRLLTDALAAGANRDHPAVRYRLGAYLLELGRPQDALPHLRRAAEQAPRAVPVWRDLARAAYETGAHAEAAVAFERTFTLATDDPDPVLRYYGAVSWLQADQPDSALAVLVPLVASAPDTVPRDWVQALVSAAAQADTSARADAGVERLLGDHPGDAGAWLLASQQAQLADDVPTAVVRLKVAAYLAPLSVHDQRRLAELQAVAGVPRQSARRYAALWDEGRGDHSVADQLAGAWLRAHEPDSARTVLSRVLAVEPTARRWSRLGDLEYELERWEEAARAYRDGLALAPDDGRMWLNLGICQWRLGRLQAAREALQRASEDPALADHAQNLLDRLAR